jgi:fluoride exporter
VTAALLVALGAALGAVARYLTDRAIQARHDSVFPWGTLAVNVAGSGILGFLAGLPAGTPVMAAAGTGFCGVLITYSTFGYETLPLLQDRARFYAAADVAASILAGLGADYCGLALAHALTTT